MAEASISSLEATMKHVVMVGVLVVAGAVAAAAQTSKTKAVTDGHAAPKVQPATAPSPAAPAGEVALGSVRFAKGVKADGKTLPAGTYQVRLTAQAANPPAKGQSDGLERWVEFTQGGQVKGREVVTIIPQSEISQVQKDTPPSSDSSKVELLKGGDFLRVWIRKGSNHYLLHLPTA
jgi:hypothetical protein